MASLFPHCYVPGRSSHAGHFRNWMPVDTWALREPGVCDGGEKRRATGVTGEATYFLLLCNFYSKEVLSSS